MTVTTTTRLSFELPVRLRQTVGEAQAGKRKTRLVVIVERARLVVEDRGRRQHLLSERLMGYLTVDSVIDL